MSSPATKVRIALLLAALVPGSADICISQKAPALRVTQEFSFGATSSHAHEDMLGNPHTALVVGDARIAVFDAHGGQVRFFSKAGILLKNAGSEGAGPGGFRHISWAGKCSGDSLFVWDQMNARVTVISSDAIIAREFQLKTADGKPSRPQTLTCSPAGYLAGQEGGRPSAALDPQAPFWRSAASIGIYSRRGEPSGRTPPIETSEMVLVGGGAAPRPLGRRTLVAMTTNRLLVGDTHSARVEVYGGDGVRLQSIQLALPNSSPPTRADHSAAVEQLMTEVRGSLRDSLRSRLQALPRASQTARYTALFVDAQALALWVVVSPIGAASTRLLRFSLAGKVTGDVTIPIPMKISEIAKGLIIGVSENSEGEPLVVGYRVAPFGK